MTRRGAEASCPSAASGWLTAATRDTSRTSQPSPVSPRTRGAEMATVPATKFRVAVMGKWPLLSLTCLLFPLLDPC